MAGRRDRDIVIRGAAEHNLRELDLSIPRGRFTVVTGPSGSGKSSLVFDTVFREAQRRFLETLPAFARHFLGGFARPEARSLEGLGPALALSQRAATAGSRSTVGTLTEVWDLLRLLMARLGNAPEGIHPTRGLFSFNGAEGACPVCQGLGVEDRLDLELLVADPTRTLREKALKVSTPNGYLMYSQVTLEVLDQVLRAHGSSVDVPWRDMGEEARNVVLYGSTRLKVPFGKHSLESRLKWTGITARPREEGHYKGLVPTMEEILRGKRNDSILRFVRSCACGACGGARLRPEALAVTWRGRTIAQLGGLNARELGMLFEDPGLLEGSQGPVLEPIRREILLRCKGMEELGLGYLDFMRGASTLSRGEAQRLRILALGQAGLRGLLLVMDEPSAGLHPREQARLLERLRRLRGDGQTLLVVEHEAAMARAADWLVDLGPGPGREGGRLLHAGPPAELCDPQGAGLGPEALGSPTRRWLLRPAPGFGEPRRTAGALRFQNLRRNNLRNLDLELGLGQLNAVCGPSGAGKSSLLQDIVERLSQEPGPFARVLMVDAEPIGRTPRSNAATYTGAFDLIRDLFAALPEAKALGLGKGHFSFNTAGGRCEACEGAGVLEVGMRHLGTVQLPCEVCGGARFHESVLRVRQGGLNIAQVLELSVAEAVRHFGDQPRLRRILEALLDAGLGHLSLGQPATTLSGGEAQRVKLAGELAKAGKGAAFIALDEPSTGLHGTDLERLLATLKRLADAGHTLLVVDNDLDVVLAADRALDLGPGGGPEGGRLVFAGSPRELAACPEASLAPFLAEAAEGRAPAMPSDLPETGVEPDPPVELRGLHTHNLQGISVSIPARGLTVITGPSGCGKSSLAFDTLLAEARNRFADLVSPWARRLLPLQGGARYEEILNLPAAVAVPQAQGRRNPRSTVGTVMELDGLLRLLGARAGERPCPDCGRLARSPRCVCGRELPALWAADLSPNAQRGACPRCKGLGLLQRCDPGRLVTHPERPLAEGALEGSRFGAYLGEMHGQHMATLAAAARELGLDLSRPWRELGEAERRLAMDGAGERVFQVAWEYQRGKRSGVHHLESAWPGLAALVEREYERVHADGRGEELEALLGEGPCPDCGGERLGPLGRSVRFGGVRLPELEGMEAGKLLELFENIEINPDILDERTRTLTASLRGGVERRLRALARAGLGHLACRREMGSLSGGEAQRVRLAAALGGGLVGVAYVLDEPSQGLHPQDTARLLELLKELAEAGNAVVVVEHDPVLVAGADHVIELGPGAGPRGGRLMAEGSPAQLRARTETWTAGLLAGRRTAYPASRPLSPGLAIRGAALHNLKGLDLELPAGALTALCGVSGSGKSTLLHQVLAESLRAGRPVGCAELVIHLDAWKEESKRPELLELRQDPSALSGRGSVATLLDLAEPLRKRFAATAGAKALGFKARHFSTAQPGGRCEACEGRGFTVVAMDLLPDLRVDCEACGGTGYGPEALSCRLEGGEGGEGLDIAELLDRPLDALPPPLAAEKPFKAVLPAALDLGLGYLRLGQEAGSLSAGEAQRLRLARLLAEPGARPVVLVLDEPGRGLGFQETGKLAAVLRRLADAGHLVVMVEHDPELIAAADRVVELGPGGGAEGGHILACCAPAELARMDTPTGRALAGTF